MPFPSGTYIAQIQDPAVRAEIEQLYALFQGFLQAEHKDSGAHGNVTADSAAVNGTLTGSGLVRFDAADIAGNNEAQVKITRDEDDLGPNLYLYGRVGQAAPVVLMETADTVASGHAPTLLMTASGASLQLTLNNSDGSGSYLSGAAKHRFDGSLYERSRTTALGEWITFTPTRTAAAGTWTAGTITTARYTLIGKTMIIAYEFDGTSVSANPSQLRFAIPGGFTAAADAYTSFMYNDNGAGWISGAGTAFTQTGLTFVALQLGTFGLTTWAISVTNTSVRGMFTLEIQ